MGVNALLQLYTQSDATRGLGLVSNTRCETVALQSNSNKYKGRSTSKVYYIKSTVEKTLKRYKEALNRLI